MLCILFFGSTSKFYQNAWLSLTSQLMCLMCMWHTTAVAKVNRLAHTLKGTVTSRWNFLGMPLFSDRSPYIGTNYRRPIFSYVNPEKLQTVRRSSLIYPTFRLPRRHLLIFHFIRLENLIKNSSLELLNQSNVLETGVLTLTARCWVDWIAKIPFIR